MNSYMYIALKGKVLTHLYSIKPVIWNDTIIIEMIVRFGLFNDMILQKFRVLLQFIIFETCANLKGGRERERGGERERERERERESIILKNVLELVIISKQ